MRLLPGPLIAHVLRPRSVNPLGPRSHRLIPSLARACALHSGHRVGSHGGVEREVAGTFATLTGCR